MKPDPRILSVTSSTHAPDIVTPSTVLFSPPEAKLMKPPSLRLCNAELNELLFFDCTSRGYFYSRRKQPQTFASWHPFCITRENPPLAPHSPARTLGPCTFHGRHLSRSSVLVFAPLAHTGLDCLR